mgnify:CR=1 FL=1
MIMYIAKTPRSTLIIRLLNFLYSFLPNEASKIRESGSFRDLQINKVTKWNLFSALCLEAPR